LAKTANMNFQEIDCLDSVRDIIKEAFDMALDIEGCFGYDRKRAFIINSTDRDLTQFEHMLATMRAHLSMSMMLPKDERYGAINLNEIKREQKSIDSKLYDIVTYEVTAMRESDYKALIEEYKEGIEREDFDMEAHFKKRKNATVKLTQDIWFDISSL
jgi:hypothetical protein